MKTVRKDTAHKKPENLPAFYALVQGRVQGVGFRYSAAREAQSLNIKGWVRNTDDGDVEIWAEGPSEKLDQFLSWLRRGPQLARVDSIKKEEMEGRGYSDFSMKH